MQENTDKNSYLHCSMPYLYELDDGFLIIITLTTKEKEKQAQLVWLSG